MVSILPSWRRSIKRELDFQARREAERVAGEESEWVGLTKDRFVTTATIDSVKQFLTQWGESYLVKLTDDDKNQLVWWSSRDPQWNFGSVGDTLTFKATVKKHDEYNGVQQTVINRCVLVD